MVTSCYIITEILTKTVDLLCKIFCLAAGDERHSSNTFHYAITVLSQWYSLYYYAVLYSTTTKVYSTTTLVLTTK